jgi:hypothetical protein
MVAVPLGYRLTSDAEPSPLCLYLFNKVFVSVAIVSKSEESEDSFPS